MISKSTIRYMHERANQLNFSEEEHAALVKGMSASMVDTMSIDREDAHQIIAQCYAELVSHPRVHDLFQEWVNLLELDM